MASIKCPKCGSINSTESNFCNKCGSPLHQKKEILCPSCKKIIPAESVFCPLCGKMVRNDIPDPRIAAPVAPSAPITFGDGSSSAPAGGTPGDIPPFEEEQASHKARNWTIGIIVGLVVAIVISLIVYNDYFAKGDKPLADSDTVATQLNPDEALQIFDETIEKQNMGSDGATSVYAANFTNAGKNLIIGLRMLSSTSGRSFYKIYTLQDTGGVWNINDNITRFIDNSSITADRQDLMLSFEDVPQIKQIDGKNYFYFMYLASPLVESTDAKSHLVFALYNIDTKDVISIDFAGTKVERDGQTFIKGEVTDMRSTPECQFLQTQVDNAKIIYKPTPEELAMDEPQNAVKKWITANSSKIDEVRSTANSVKWEVSFYDKPIFNKSALADGKRIDNEAYIFLCDKKGAVYGYNKKARTYFVVYAPVNSSAAATIEFNPDGTLHVTASGIEFNYDAKITEATGIQ